MSSFIMKSTTRFLFTNNIVNPSTFRAISTSKMISYPEGLSYKERQAYFRKEMLSSFKSSKNITVVGSGSFGTALATIAARNNHKVTMFGRNSEQMSAINTEHRNTAYLTDFELLPNIIGTTSIKQAFANPDLIILALPVQLLPVWLAENKDKINPKTLICNSAKGMYLKDECLLSEAIRNALGRDQPYAVLSGPSFAKEMMEDTPTAVVVASKFLTQAVTIQRMLSSPTFLIETSQDVLGVEMGGALKNPLAIGAGMIEGLGLGINTTAAYITRSSLELKELCKALGGQPQSISGLSGIGDLMLTAFGDLSRNRMCGARLARGDTLAEIQKHSTVEGIATARVAVKYADACNLKVPIFRAVAAIIDGEMSIEEAHLHILG